MDDQSLRNVLSLMRRIKGAGVNATPKTLIQGMAGDDISPRQLHRVAAYLQDQLEQARLVIDNSNLVAEAKSGVNAAINTLTQTFHISSLGASFGPSHTAMDGYISNFVILLSAAGVPSDAENPEEAVSLAGEIDNFAKQAKGLGLDPDVANIVQRHLVILSTLLRHIPIFGIEPALTAYFEFVSRLRRADSKSSPTSQAATEGFMGQVKNWGERLSTVDKVVNSGANLLQRVQGAAPLLQYLPGLS